MSAKPLTMTLPGLKYGNVPPLISNRLHSNKKKQSHLIDISSPRIFYMQIIRQAKLNF